MLDALQGPIQHGSLELRPARGGSRDSRCSSKGQAVPTTAARPCVTRVADSAARPPHTATATATATVPVSPTPGFLRPGPQQYPVTPAPAPQQGMGMMMPGPPASHATFQHPMPHFNIPCHIPCRHNGTRESPSPDRQCRASTPPQPLAPPSIALPAPAPPPSQQERMVLARMESFMSRRRPKWEEVWVLFEGTEWLMSRGVAEEQAFHVVFEL